MSLFYKLAYTLLYYILHDQKRASKVLTMTGEILLKSRQCNNTRKHLTNKLYTYGICIDEISSARFPTVSRLAFYTPLSYYSIFC